MLKATLSAMAGCLIAGSAFAEPVALSPEQMDVVAGGSFVCPVISTEAVLHSKHGGTLSNGDYTVAPPGAGDITVMMTVRAALVAAMLRLATAPTQRSGSRRNCVTAGSLRRKINCGVSAPPDKPGDVSPRATRVEYLYAHHNRDRSVVPGSPDGGAGATRALNT
jgi:hypothetical protein